MNWRRGMLSAGIFALGLAPAAALAQEDEIVIDEDMVRVEEKQNQTTAALRGGVGVYTGDLGEVTGLGPQWGVTVNLNRRSPLNYEVTYMGARFPTTLGLNEGAVWQNGVQAAAKLSPLESFIDPFVGAGIGASFLNATSEVEDRLLNADGSDLLGEVPLMGGVEFGQGPITAGLRATYHLWFGEELAGGGNMWSGEATLGGSF